MTDAELIKLAMEARKRAYVPYSRFSVGAALLCKDGSVYQGCNIENAAYGPTNCAERTAFFRAIYDGERDFEAIGIVAGAVGKPATELSGPCGVCRQVMMEFCDPKTFRIVMATDPEQPISRTLEELLPLGFGPANLECTETDE